MTLFIYILKLLAFFISNVGFWELLSQKTSINLFYYPVLTISLQINVLFFAGLLNCLPQATFLLYGFGLACFVFFRLKGNASFAPLLFNRGYIFLFSSCAIVGYIVYGQLFSYYDNFSHWAVMTQQLFYNDSYPTFATPQIMYQSYPPATATFIYYFSKIVNNTEHAQMFAQNYISISCLVPLFRYINKGGLTKSIYLYLLSNFIFMYNVYLCELAVDTVLALVGACTIIFFVDECLFNNSANTTPTGKYSFIFANLLSITVMLIKNSGIFFSSIIAFLTIISLYRNRNLIAYKISTIFSPFVALFLWKAHCALVFPKAALSRHAMSISNYAQGIHNKTTEDILNIIKQMSYFSFSGSELLIILIASFILGTIIYINFSDLFTFYVRFWLGAFCCYIIYMLGMLAMYIFSMPIGEALRLAGAIRYRRTVIIVMIVLLSAVILHLLELKINKLSNSTLLVILFTIIFSIWGNAIQFSNIFQEPRRFQHRWVADTRTKLEQCIKKYHIPKKKSYAMLIPSSDYGCTYHLSKYLLVSSRVKSIKVSKLQDMDDMHNYEYIVNFDSKNDIIKTWLINNFKPGPNWHYIQAQ